MRILDLTDPEWSTWEEYNKYLDVVCIDISEEDVKWVATLLIGAAGISGTDALALQIWLLQFCTSLSSLREEMS